MYSKELYCNYFYLKHWL